MTKKKTNNKNAQLPLVIAGYSLFALLIVAVALTTAVPFGKMLFSPHVLRFNVSLFMISLIVGALLPALVGYFIGDHAVKAKSRVRHHFNGALLGLLAMWIMMLLGMFVWIPYESFGLDDRVRIVLANLFPSVVIASIATALAVAHVRSRKATHDLIEYKPYGILLIASIVAMPIGLMVNSLVVGSRIGIDSLLYLGVLLLLGAISYATLRKSKVGRFNKVMWSAVSVSVAFVSVFILSQFAIGVSYYINATPTMEFQAGVGTVGIVLGLVGWIVYWWAQVKSLSR